MASGRLIFGLIGLHLVTAVVGADPTCEAIAGGSCPPGWSPFEDRCYRATTELWSSWFDAKEECVRAGSVLVAPRSLDENDFLVRLTQPPSQVFYIFWINCNDLDQEGNWTCAGGHDGTFTNWKTVGDVQPDNAHDQEHCAAAGYGSGTWNDVQCTNVFRGPIRAVCVRPAPQLHF